MSSDWCRDIAVMHNHYGFHDKVKRLTREELIKLLGFRRDFMKEEMRELNDAVDQLSPEDFVDALVDLCVVAIGTLDLFGVDGKEAWDRVLEANMNKEVGVKPSRPNPLGLPDLVKPEGWEGPSHEGNHGRLPDSTTFSDSSDFGFGLKVHVK